MDGAVTTVVRLAGPQDLDGVYAVRHEVFVVEQGVPVELERDELDAAADHAVAVDAAGAVVGTGRLVDGRIDDPAAGWKGRGLWTTSGDRTPWLMEGGKGSRPRAVHFQIRPDPLAK